MFKTRDGLVRIDIAEDLSEVTFPTSDFSIVNMPSDHEEAEDLFDNLYNSPTNRHLSLVFCRHKRSDKLSALSNFSKIKNFEYLDSVHVWYEKASSSSNNGLLPVSEQAVIVFKGSTPDVKNTAWFGEQDGQSNATTLWNVSSQDGEPQKNTYYQKFCWETAMLLMSMSYPLESKRFIYGYPLDSDALSLFSFVKKYKIEVQLYVKTTKEANDLLEKYKEYP
jgi:hypothetical protein